MEVYYFTKQENKTGISPNNEPYEIIRINLEVFLEEAVYDQRKHKDCFSYLRIDQSSLLLIKVNNVPVKYSIEIDYYENASSCDGSDNAKQLITEKQSEGFLLVPKSEFIDTRNKLIEFCKPLFKIHFDTTNTKEFRYKRDYWKYTLSPTLAVFVKDNENEYNPVRMMYFDFVFGLDKTKWVRLHLNNDYTRHKDLKTARKWFDTRGSQIISKRNFHRIYKRMIKKFANTEYFDFDMIEAKTQGYGVTILDM